jgi:hypothetical protein
MAEIDDIAEAVNAALLAQASADAAARAHNPPLPTVFAVPFTPVHLNKAVFDEKELATLHVTVVPVDIEERAFSRGEVQYIYQVGIAIQRQTDASVADVGPLQTLAQQIRDFFRLKRCPGYADAMWVGAAQRGPFDPAALVQAQILQITVILHYTVIR